MPEIVENRATWWADYEAGFLKHYQETGEANYKAYNYVKNETPVSGNAVDLSQSRLLFISTAGTYLKGEQEPFDAPNLMGDYSMRTYPVSTDFADLAVAQDHYDHTAINEDRQVLLPLRHLEAMVEAGLIGELVPSVVSYSGYQPDVTRIADELAAQIVAFAQREQAHAALLVPA